VEEAPGNGFSSQICYQLIPVRRTRKEAMEIKKKDLEAQNKLEVMRPVEH